MSTLMEEWLGAVNQPVVDSICEAVNDLLEDVSDHGNFTPEQCKAILCEIVLTRPNKEAQP